MKKSVIGIGGLILVSLLAVAIRFVSPSVVADTERGLSPFSAFSLNAGRNTGVLAPGEGRWYVFTPGTDGAFQQQADLTLFFTPDDGNRTFRVAFQIFPADQIRNWYGGDMSQMQNLGAGGVVSRDGNPVTGELLWSGWVENNGTYYVQVFNGADVTIDYWLFTDNVIAAELGPSPDYPPALEEAEVDTNPSLAASPTQGASPMAVEADSLLPLASELQSDNLGGAWGAGDVPLGTPSRLVIPSIALDSEVIWVGQTPIVIGGVTYGQWNTADDAVGWHDLSARLGQVGNTVLNGHSDVDAAVFRNLRYVQIGDQITVFSGDRGYHYVVKHRFLVRESDVPLEERVKNAAWIAPMQDERLTLITCANAGATHRLIVIARPWPGKGGSGDDLGIIGF